jgi:hypothetical protein
MEHSVKLKEEVARLRKQHGSERRPLSLRDVGNMADLSATAVMRLADGLYGEKETLIKLAVGFGLPRYHFLEVVGLPIPTDHAAHIEGIDEESRIILDLWRAIPVDRRAKAKRILEILAD